MHPAFRPRLLLLASLMLAASSLAGEVVLKQKFNLPIDTAEKSLKRFSEQSRRSVMFATENVKDVQTNLVEGEYTAPEAMRRLLAGTPLRAIPEVQTGGFAVARATAKTKDANGPNGQRAAPITNGDRPPKTPILPQKPQKP